MDQKIDGLRDELMDKIRELEDSDKAQQNSIESADEKIGAQNKAIDELMDEIAQLKEIKCDKSDEIKDCNELRNAINALSKG